MKENSTLSLIEIKESVNITSNSTEVLYSLSKYSIISSKVKLKYHKKYNSFSKTSSYSPKVSKKYLILQPSCLYTSKRY